jgi:hypothetical protein
VELLSAPGKTACSVMAVSESKRCGIIILMVSGLRRFSLPELD